jgi:Leucine-rich repeat (LRR) protein
MIIIHINDLQEMKNYIYIITFITALTSCKNNKKELSNDRFLSYESYSAYTIEFDCKGIPDSVYEMRNLKTLTITGQDCDYTKFDKNGNEIVECCFLDSISPKIGNFKKLEELNLPLSAINSLPSTIVNCKKLREINLTDGIISNIDNIVYLENLEELILFGCHIEKLPLEIGKLRKLKYLGLSGNNIDKNEIMRIKKAIPNCEIIYN